MVYDLTLAKRLAEIDIPEVLSRATDLAGSGAELERRMTAEIASLLRAIDAAPEEKQALKQRLTTLAMQLSKLSEIMTKSRHQGRPDLEEAAKQRRDVTIVQHGAAQMDLNGFDTHHGLCRQLLQALERQRYAVGLGVQRELKRREGSPEPMVSPSEVLPSMPVVDGDAQSQSSTSDASVEAVPDLAGPNGDVATDIRTNAEPSTERQAAASDVAAPQTKDEPKESADLDAEFAELMAAMGEDSSEQATAQADGPDDDADLADIMAGLELEEVDENALPEGAAEELAREDAQIAAQARKTGVKIANIEPEPKLPAAAPVASAEPPAAAKSAAAVEPSSSAATGKSPKPTKRKRLWLWFTATAIAGAGGYAAYVYVIAPM